MTAHDTGGSDLFEPLSTMTKAAFPAGAVIRTQKAAARRAELFSYIDSFLPVEFPGR
jgi:hypothetical protein